MTQYYNVVPWFNTKEWLSVYDKICAIPSTTAAKQDALNLINIWKVRCPSLPSGIESTMSLLDVQLADLGSLNSDNNQEGVLRLAYSSAIMRFVNHMLDTQTARGVSLYHAAKKLEVPDWVIDLRHDAAHSNNLPSLELLREAADISLQWLVTNYWDKHKAHIQDYVLSISDQLGGQLANEDDDEDKDMVDVTLNMCQSLSICAHTECKIKDLEDLDDYGLLDSIIVDIMEFFGRQINLDKPKNVSLVMLINRMNGNSGGLLDGKSATVNRILLGKDSLILSQELVDELCESDFHVNNTLNKTYIQCFEFLLAFLHCHDLILEFILELISITSNDSNGHNKCKLAALWVSEILKALKKTQDLMEVSSEKFTDISNKNKRKHFKQAFPHHDMASCNLLLDLGRRVPEELTSLNYVQPIISTYNPYLTYFMKDLLNLIQPQLPRATVENICTLAEMISSPKFPATGNKLYTVEDLKMHGDFVTVDDSSDSDCVEVEDENMKFRNSLAVTDNDSGGWTLASPDHDWSSCPIGLLPWQRAPSCMEVDS